MSAKSRALVIAALAMTVLAGCAGTPSQPQSGDTRFVAGDGSMQVFPATARQAAPAVQGETLEGGAAGLADHKGKVVVLNFWASWCAPCRSEAPVLKDIAAKTKDRGVQFIGVDFKDDKAQALAFQRTQQPGYPSLFDQPGRVALAFHGMVNPAAIPSTLVLDRQGRVAARALGEVQYSSLLDAVTKVSDEK
ncbi:TlpA family protein disulfide reductase [Sphaerisporangium fuscum]|uniref:TlpA family protein disulfide reductase n=1 Tax=Sphaerisporangium fuscum TaxID=2835868 RepID=UPI0027E268CC|nr:TlpA disulfide reductase family protein [Sphaerisporangium fuscum]